MSGMALCKKAAKAAATSIAVAYSGIVFLLWVLQWWISEAVPGMALVKSFLELLLLPALLLFAVFLVLRQRRSTLALAPAVVAFLISYGPFLLPRQGKAVSPSATLTIMSFNLEAPDTQEAAALAQIIAAANADVVAVQELSPEAAAQFRTLLAARYPYQALHPQQQDHSGQGVLSRFPLQHDEYWRYDEIAGALGHQRVELTIGRQQVVLYNSHVVPPVTLAPTLRPAAHIRALNNLLLRIESDSGPMLISGDFNMTDQFHGYRELNQRFSDAYRAVGAVGFGFTYPDNGIPFVPPLLRLDYVFYDDAFTGISARVWPDSGPSDHLPLVAMLSLNSPASLGQRRCAAYAALPPECRLDPQRQMPVPCARSSLRWDRHTPKRWSLQSARRRRGLAPWWQETRPVPPRTSLHRLR
jgi:endonuclease/exonuclease/phosphatase (EEP) superfamily protein YafD